MTAPTLEPVEYRILDDLRTTLEAIATDHPSVSFYTDVKKVHVMNQNPTGTGNTLEMPCAVLIGKGLVSEYYDATELVAKRAWFDIYLLIERKTTWLRDVYRFASDIERAVLVDCKRGTTPDDNANAFDTTLLEVDIANLEPGNHVAMARVAIAVDFRSSVTDPTQQG